jgi:hypothetical protein
MVLQGERDLVSLRAWLVQIGVTASTAWRWRKKGLLDTVNIYGRLYVTRAAREKFLARAESGEFAQEPVTPKKQKGGQHDTESIGR